MKFPYFYLPIFVPLLIHQLQFLDLFFERQNESSRKSPVGLREQIVIGNVLVDCGVDGGLLQGLEPDIVGVNCAAKSPPLWGSRNEKKKKPQE